MDSFDDFQMKPITEGLGFHKKSIDLKKATQDSGIAKSSLGSNLPTPPPESLLNDEPTVADAPAEKIEARKPEVKAAQKEIDQLLEALNKATIDIDSVSDIEETTEAASAISDDEVNLTKPLPTEATAAPATINPTPETLIPDSIIPTIPVPETPTPIPNRHLDFVEEKPKHDSKLQRGAGDSPLRLLEPIPVSFSAAGLDALVTGAFALLFLLSLLLVTGVELSSVFASSQNEMAVQMSLVMIYVATLMIYTVISRSFFARTLGEWTFDLQMGDFEQAESSMYPLLAAWRSLLTIMTGVVVLPLMSLILKQDLASYLCGLQLYRRR